MSARLAIISALELIYTSARRGRLFIFPPRSAENITQLQPPCVRTSHVIPDIDPLMEGDAQRIIAVDILGQTVNHFFAFGFKGAKEAVPDDENTGVVAVEIALV